MTGFIDSIGASLSAIGQRLEAVSQNIANVSTPGYKRQSGFAAMVAAQGGQGQDMPLAMHPDLAQGTLSQTGNPLDLAISGAGFFQLRDGEKTLYGRGGQFRLGEDGIVLNAQGLALQTEGGGDLVMRGTDVEITQDGTVLADGYPVARIAIVEPADGAEVTALSGSLMEIAEADVEPAREVRLRQGMTEDSNVAMGDEMIAMMAAVRQAESQARMVQIWDQLSGRAINAFSQGG